MEIISNILGNSDSILLAFVALVLIALVPIYRGISKINAQYREENNSRENKLIQVIEKNTEAITKLEMHIEFEKEIVDENLERLSQRVALLESSAS